MGIVFVPLPSLFSPQGIDGNGGVACVHPCEQKRKECVPSTERTVWIELWKMWIKPEPNNPQVSQPVS